MSVRHLDRLGNDIKPASYFVYSANGGRAAILKVGVVLELATRKDRVYNPATKTWGQGDLPLLKCLTADRWSHWSPDQTWGIQGKGGATSWNKKADPEQVGRVMTLSDLEKVCVVPEESLPIDLRMMFRKAYHHHRPSAQTEQEKAIVSAMAKAFSTVTDESLRKVGDVEDF